MKKKLWIIRKRIYGESINGGETRKMDRTIDD